MKTSYFTFGFQHTHMVGDRLLDQDTVVKIAAENPLVKMEEMFGKEWSVEYDELPDMSYYPGGVVEL